MARTIASVRATHGGVTAFFYAHAGWSYDPKTETSDVGRLRCAIAAARAESDGCAAGLSFDWSIDPDSRSTDWRDDGADYAQWQCICRDADGAIVDALGGIDFGPDGSPWADPYRRCVESDLAAEYLARVPAE